MKVTSGLDYQDKKRQIVQRYADIVNELQMSTEILKSIDTTLEN